MSDVVLTRVWLQMFCPHHDVLAYVMTYCFCSRSAYKCFSLIMMCLHMSPCPCPVVPSVRVTPSHGVYPLGYSIITSEFQLPRIITSSCSGSSLSKSLLPLIPPCQPLPVQGFVRHFSHFWSCHNLLHFRFISVMALPSSGYFLSWRLSIRVTPSWPCLLGWVSSLASLRRGRGNELTFTPVALWEHAAYVLILIPGDKILLCLPSVPKKPQKQVDWSVFPPQHSKASWSSE